MANQHYNIDEEIEVTIKLKLKDIGISDYNYLNEEEIKESFAEFKKEIGNHLKSTLVKNYYQQDITSCVDWWSFEVSEVVDNPHNEKES